MRWHRGICRVWGACLALLLGGLPAQRAMGQSPLKNEILAELQVLGGRAATAFVGQITAIQRRGSVVEVTFRVERPVHGSVGGTFVLREWAGMWVPGQPRYSVGQRVLAFVHAGSAAGFSSPVHGAEGLVPVQVQGANAPMLLDVRRVAASVVRPLGVPLPSGQEGTLPLDDVLAVVYPGQQASYGGSTVRLQPVDGRPEETLRPVSGAGAAASGTPRVAGRLPLAYAHGGAFDAAR